jgi:PAS domain S-box-containing protein
MPPVPTCGRSTRNWSIPMSPDNRPRSRDIRPRHCSGTRRWNSCRPKTWLRSATSSAARSRPSRASACSIATSRASGEIWWEEVYGAVFCDDTGNVIGLRGTGMSINARKQAEEELRRSEQRFRDIAEVSGDWIWEVDAEGRYTYVSEGVRRMLGYTPEEVLGRTPFDFMAPEEAATVGAAFAALAAEKKAFTDLENVVRSPRRFRAHTTLDQRHPDPGSGWQLLGYRGIDRDITARRANENRIRRLTTALRRPQRMQPGHRALRLGRRTLSRHLPRRGRVRRDEDGLDRGFRRGHGPRVLPVASSGSGLEYLDGILITTDAADPHGRGPVGTALREDRPVWNQDFLNDPLTLPWRERAQRYGWGAVAALPLHRGGRVVGAFTLYAGESGAFDDDARRLLEEMAVDISYALDGFERDASIKLAAAVFEQGKEGIMITDTSGRIVRVNRAFSEISGYSEAEALGNSAGLLSSGRHGPEFYREMWAGDRCHRALAGRDLEPAQGRPCLSGVAGDQPRPGCRRSGQSLRRHFQRHHAPQGGRSAHPAPGPLRCPDRPAQSCPVARSRASCTGHGAAQRRAGGGAVPRSRSFQEHQRHARPPHRRRTAGRGGQTHGGGDAQGRHRVAPGRRRVRHGPAGHRCRRRRPRRAQADRHDRRQLPGRAI